LSFLIYIKDQQKFYDKRTGGALLSRDKALERLKASDDKFHDLKIAYDALADIELTGITTVDLKESKSQKKSAVQLNEVWNELQPLIRLKKQIQNNGQSQIFHVAENNEVTKIDYVEDQSLVDALIKRTEEYAAIRNFYDTHPIAEEIRKSIGYAPFLKRMLNEFWHADERVIFSEEPRLISWDTEELAYKQMDPSLLKPGPTPTWDEFTSRLDHPAVFMAWVWSIFEPTNNIRQVMWLKGGGNDGKSSVQKAIEGVIGKQYCYSMKPGDESQQWFGKNVYGKVLVNFADCRNQFLIDANSIKQLTGGDTTSIEGKGENSFTGKIYSKVLVTSNYLPKINPELQAHTSRLIKIDVAPQDDAKKDAAFELRLQNEIYAFLTKCKEAFDCLISPGGERLELPVELADRIKTECASDTYMNIQDFVEEYVQFSPEEICVPSELRRTSKKYFSFQKQISAEQMKHHETELNTKLHLMGCGLQRLELDGKFQTVWRGFRLKKSFDMVD
jgi:hypothetical protein